MPLRLFKALQLVHTRNLKADFDDFVAFDIETSDFDFESSQIVDIAAVRVRGNVVVDQFHSLVSCTRPISAQATEVHGYTDGDLIGAPPMSEVWQRFREFVGSDLVVAHNGQEFDVPVLRRACGGFEGFEDLVFYDTLPLARAVVDGSVKLKYLAQKFNVDVRKGASCVRRCTGARRVVPRPERAEGTQSPDDRSGPPSGSARLGSGARSAESSLPRRRVCSARSPVPSPSAATATASTSTPPRLTPELEGALGLEEVIERLGGHA